MEKKQVVKRGGNREDFSPAKIRKTIERAAAGFELDLQPLEEKMADFAKDGVSTAEIAKYLTLSALSLTTVTDPDWKNAAGRLKLFELYKQMSETRQTGKNYNNLYDYPQFLKFAEENESAKFTAKRKSSWQQALSSRNLILCMTMPELIC